MAIDLRHSPLRFTPFSLCFCRPAQARPSWLRLHVQGVMIPLFTCEGLNASQANKED